MNDISKSSVVPIAQPKKRKAPASATALDILKDHAQQQNMESKKSRKSTAKSAVREGLFDCISKFAETNPKCSELTFKVLL